MVARRAILAVSASVIVVGCSATGAYGGYTKGEAKDAGRYGLEQLAQQARTQYKQLGLPADFSPEGYRSSAPSTRKRSPGAMLGLSPS